MENAAKNLAVSAAEEVFVGFWSSTTTRAAVWFPWDKDDLPTFSLVDEPLCNKPKLTKKLIMVPLQHKNIFMHAWPIKMVTFRRL